MFMAGAFDPKYTEPFSVHSARAGAEDRQGDANGPSSMRRAASASQLKSTGLTSSTFSRHDRSDRSGALSTIGRLSE
jgi:hypothetical protein